MGQMPRAHTNPDTLLDDSHCIVMVSDACDDGVGALSEVAKCVLDDAAGVHLCCDTPRHKDTTHVHTHLTTASTVGDRGRNKGAGTTSTTAHAEDAPDWISKQLELKGQLLSLCHDMQVPHPLVTDAG